MDDGQILFGHMADMADPKEHSIEIPMRPHSAACPLQPRLCLRISKTLPGTPTAPTAFPPLSYRVPTAPYHYTPNPRKSRNPQPAIHLPQLQLNITPTPQSPSPQTPTWVGKQLSVTGPYTTHTTSVTHTPPSPWAPIYNPTAYRLSYMSYKLRAWD